MSILEAVYQLLIVILSPVVGLVFLFFRRGRARLSERFGNWKHTGSSSVIWLHGASNGEVRGLIPLIKVLRERHADTQIIVTATSVSAFDSVRTFGVECHLAPFDCLWFYRRAFSRRPVKLLVVAETEIWPMMLRFAAENRIPVMIVNARISDYSAGRYRILAPLLRRYFRKIEKVFVADSVSEQRFRNLGASQVEFAGNMKYDSAPSLSNSEQIAQWRREYSFPDCAIITLGSVRPGEEKPWIAALRRRTNSALPLLVIIAPRHLEKVDYFVEVLVDSGLSFCRWSEKGRAQPSVAVLLIDDFGVLERCYAISSLAFIGGSLVDVGGHNPLEAAAYSVPVCMGPYHSTVLEIVTQLKSVNAFLPISLNDDLSPLLARVAEEDAELVKVGERGRSVWQACQGATLRVYSSIERLLRTMP